MTEPTLAPACALCGGPVSKKNTSGFCNRSPECKRRAQSVANARYREAHPEKVTERWAAYSPGYKERRAELDANRRQDPEFREKVRKAVLEYKRRPENTDRVKEYNRRGRLRYLARADRHCVYGHGCGENAKVGDVFCAEHRRLDARLRYYRNKAELQLFLADRQDWICPWCSDYLPPSLRKTHVDHIIPRACGLVIEEEWNLQLLHARCNQEKSDRITPRAMALAVAHGLVLAVG